MSNLVPFEFETNNVRIILDENNDSWFVLRDVTAVLGIKNSGDVKADLDADESAIVSIDTGSKSGVEQQRQVTAVNESGLYVVIMRSRKPTAKRFRKWVTSEVLPSIRKTSQYRVQRSHKFRY